ncbi:MAG: hypothetical protein JNK85_28165 [Verrucomicrobiales bacterium]|nr:hypothetical protein [Verrucomicrobiales bacterium]
MPKASIPNRPAPDIGSRSLLAGLGILFSPVAASALIHIGSSDHLLPSTVPGTDHLGRRVGELQIRGAPGFLGTPIGPRHFVTAAHIVFAVGDPFFFQGHTFTVTGRTLLPNSDLALATVDADFPEYSELYERDDEVRRPVVVLGKGRWKGDPVVVEGVLKGWRYAETGVAGIRWGTNLITGSITSTNTAPGELAGAFLTADFDRAGGDDEVHFTVGDSGSPLFLSDCGVWKLAGVASAVDGPFRPTDAPQVTPFLAALFDVGGLTLVPEKEPPTAYPVLPEPQPTGWYAARISSKVDQLRALAGLPNPAVASKVADVFAPLSAQGTAAVSLSVAGVACVDDRSQAGAAVTWDGMTARYSASVPGPNIDAFRYVVANDDARSGWASVYVVDLSSVGTTPILRFCPDGTPVLLWPLGSQSAVAGLEVGPTPAGPWDRTATVPQVLEGVALYPDPVGREQSGRFYRLVLSE